jgi:hypothetical protein
MEKVMIFFTRKFNNVIILSIPYCKRKRIHHLQTKAMLIYPIYRRKPRVNRKPKMKIRIGTEKIAIVKHHRILGLIIDERIKLEQAYPRC